MSHPPIPPNCGPCEYLFTGTLPRLDLMTEEARLEWRWIIAAVAFTAWTDERIRLIDLRNTLYEMSKNPDITTMEWRFMLKNGEQTFELSIKALENAAAWLKWRDEQ